MEERNTPTTPPEPGASAESKAESSHRGQEPQKLAIEQLPSRARLGGQAVAEAQALHQTINALSELALDRPTTVLETPETFPAKLDGAEQVAAKLKAEHERLAPLFEQAIQQFEFTALEALPTQASELTELVSALEQNKARARALDMELRQLASERRTQILGTVGVTETWDLSHKIDMSSLAEQQSKATLRRTQNSWLGLGRWVKRTQIEATAAQLSTANEETQRLNAAQEELTTLERQIKAVRHDLAAAQQIAHLTEAFQTKLIALGHEVLKRFDTQASSEPTPEKLSPEILRSLDEQYLQTIVFPKLRSRSNNHLYSGAPGGSLQRALEANPRLLEELKPHFLAALELPMNIQTYRHTPSPEEQAPLAAVEAWWEQTGKHFGLRPDELRGLQRWFDDNGIFIRTNESVHSLWSRYVGFATHAKAGAEQTMCQVKAAQVVDDQQKLFDTLERSRHFRPEYGSPLRADWDQLRADLRALDRKLSGKQSVPPFQTFASKYDSQLWTLLQTNPVLQEEFGAQLTMAEEQLSQFIAIELMAKPGHTAESIERGFKLLAFDNPELVPVALLNCYRETGTSGEYPFRHGYNGKSRESQLFRYLSSLTSEMRRTVGEVSPRAARIIELILSHPDDYDNPYLASNKEFIFMGPKNPVYLQIQRELALLATDLATSPDPDHQHFALNTLRSLDEVDDLSLAALLDVLGRSTDPKVLGMAENLLEQKLREGNREIVEAVLGSWNKLSEASRERMSARAAELLKPFVTHPDPPPAPAAVEQLATMLHTSAPQLEQLFAFWRDLTAIWRNNHYQGFSYQSNEFAMWIDVATQPSLRNAALLLAEYGFSFDSYDMDLLKQVGQAPDGARQDLEEIRAEYPNYQFRKTSFRTHDANIEHAFAPYAELFKQWPLNEFLDRVAKQGTPNDVFLRGLLANMRLKDALLRGSPTETQPASLETLERFTHAIERWATDPASVLRQSFGDHYASQEILQFLARSPERVDELFALEHEAPNLLEQLQPGGVLHANLEQVVRDLFSNGSLSRRAQELERLLTKRLPYGEFLFFYTDIRLGDELANAASSYPISTIGRQSIPELVERHRTTKATHPDQPTRLEQIVPDDATRQALLDGTIATVPFWALSGVYKRLVFRSLLVTAVETSRSMLAKHRADQRNRALEAEGLQFSAGDYLHSSGSDFVESVLLSGTLAKESLGEFAQTDAFPFHVDFVRLQPQDITEQPDTRQIIEGSFASLGIGGHQLWYRYVRTKSAWQGAVEYSADGAGGRHALVLGAIPSTEISGIILGDPASTIERVKRAIAEHGSYIPVYDMDGQLLLSSAEYDANRAEFNLGVPVEVWDFSMRRGGNLGSNQGAEFIVPSETGGPVRSYVKFAKPHEPETRWQLWEEYLTDEIYRRLEVPVPATKMVRFEDSEGRASVWIDGQSAGRAVIHAQPSWQAGFLADALLANWDIPYAPERNCILGKDNIVYRIDNGGALMFRARGERKGGLFSADQVPELEAGTNHEEMGFGMRQEYPGLTNEEIQRQGELMRQQLTDEAIEQLVDSIRSPSADRQELKRTLKGRRDVILAWVADQR